MKRAVLCSLLLSFLATTSFGQLDDNAMIGTWEAELSANRIFRINVFEVSQSDANYLTYANIQGHFEMVQVESDGSETIIYTSDRDMCEGCNLPYPPAFFLNTDGGEQVSGYVIDNSGINVADAYIRINFIADNPLRVDWLVHQDGPNISRPARPVNIPTDLQLTKIE